MIKWFFRNTTNNSGVWRMKIEDNYLLRDTTTQPPPLQIGWKWKKWPLSENRPRTPKMFRNGKCWLFSNNNTWLLLTQLRNQRFWRFLKIFLKSTPGRGWKISHFSEGCPTFSPRKRRKYAKWAYHSPRWVISIGPNTIQSQKHQESVCIKILPLYYRPVCSIKSIFL